MEALFADAAQRDSPSDFNTAFACRLTLEPFREPVILFLTSYRNGGACHRRLLENHSRFARN